MSRLASAAEMANRFTEYMRALSLSCDEIMASANQGKKPKS